jgi:hypothetical protein
MATKNLTEEVRKNMGRALYNKIACQWIAAQWRIDRLLGRVPKVTDWAYRGFNRDAVLWLFARLESDAKKQIEDASDKVAPQRTRRRRCATTVQAGTAGAGVAFVPDTMANWVY